MTNKVHPKQQCSLSDTESTEAAEDREDSAETRRGLSVPYRFNPEDLPDTFIPNRRPKWPAEWSDLIAQIRMTAMCMFWQIWHTGFFFGVVSGGPG